MVYCCLGPETTKTENVEGYTTLPTFFSSSGERKKTVRRSRQDTVNALQQNKQNQRKKTHMFGRALTSSRTRRIFVSRARQKPENYREESGKKKTEVFHGAKNCQNPEGK
jgi:hypothetical protein